MKLVERHIITKNHPLWSEIDHKSFLSKNLFNLANYHYRQHFFAHHQKLNFNQLYHLLSQTPIKHNQNQSQRLKNLTHKRNCRVDNYLHTASRRVIDWCRQHQIGILVIGHNAKWKQSINLGKRNNQQFVNIPHYRLIEMLTYKAQLKGIKIVITEESYTSVASGLDGDALPKYGEKKPVFKGHRIARGLYKTGNGRLLNADVNGSFNITRKVIPDVFDQGIKGLPFNPVVLDPLRMTGPRSL